MSTESYKFLKFIKEMTVEYTNASWNKKKIVTLSKLKSRSCLDSEKDINESNKQKNIFDQNANLAEKYSGKRSFLLLEIKLCIR
ncbi:hypothetical protein KKE60_08445 [Patescibacteria group bacterium]|nr:hypothetical protein [Patescibacteria group bacterium]